MFYTLKEQWKMHTVSLLVIGFCVCAFHFIAPYIANPKLLASVLVIASGALLTLAFAVLKAVEDTKSIDGLSTQELYGVRETANVKVRRLKRIMIWQFVSSVVVGIGLVVLKQTNELVFSIIIYTTAFIIGMCFVNFGKIMQIHDEVSDFNSKLSQKKEDKRRKKEGRERLEKIKAQDAH
jgi:hypothetical protein